MKQFMTNLGMEHIILPFGDRQTLFSCSGEGLTALETFPLFTLDHRAEIGCSFLVTFAACKSALIVQAWWLTGRVGVPEVIELPKGICGEAFLITSADELFVGGKSDRPWLGRMNLLEPIRSWVSLLPDEDLKFANEKGIDALSLTPYGDRLIAYDNLMLPLYAWIMDRSEQGWSKPKRIEIEPEYTYEHIVSAYATDDLVYLITRGVNHGKSMQFLRRFDRNAQKSELLLSETKKDIYSENSENEAIFESGQEWSQVMATVAGTVLIAAGDHGLGRYNINSGLMYLGNQPANYIALIDQGVSVAVAFQNREKASPFRWEIDVYLTEGQSEFPRLQLSSI